MLKVNMTNDCLTLNAVSEFSPEASFKGFFFLFQIQRMTKQKNETALCNDVFYFTRYFSLSVN